MNAGRETVVVKFGGSMFPQEGLYKGFEKAGNYLTQLYNEGYQLVGVVSAVNGMSDFVLETERVLHDRGYRPKNPVVAKAAKFAGDRKRFAKEVSDGIMEIYAREIPSGRGRLLGEIEREVEKLKASIAEEGNEQVRRALPENHSGILLYSVLRDAGFDSAYLDGMQVGVKTNPRGTVKRHVSSFEIRNALEGHLGRGKIPVVGGYIGRRLDNGEPTTFGRNTTDVTGAAVSFALGAAEYQIIKVVPGVYRIEPEIKIDGETIRIETDFLRRMSYGEATQIAWRGSKVVHPHAIDISRDGKIPIRVKSIESGEGTLISETSDTTPERPVAAVSTESFHLLSVDDPAMIVPEEGRGYIRDVIDTLTKCGLGFFDLAKSPSVLTLAVPTIYDGRSTDIESAMESLRGCLKEMEYTPRSVLCNNVFGMSMTGEAMKGTPGVTARIAGIFGKEGVSIVMGGQSDEREGAPVINYYVDPKDARRALEALCTELFC